MDNHDGAAANDVDIVVIARYSDALKAVVLDTVTEGGQQHVMQ